MVVLTTIGLAGTLAYKTGKFGVKSLYNGVKFIGKGAYNMTRRNNKPNQKKSRKSRESRDSRKSRKSY